MTFEQIKNILKNKVVGVAGAGGLGSNCVAALTRVGVGTIIIADHDKVSETNLNRQYFFFDQIGKSKVAAIKENLERINPSVNIVACEVKLVPDNIITIFQSCEVIVEAFDLAVEKEMFIETVLLHFPDKPLVVGLGMAGWGRNDLIHVRKLDKMYICGDEVSEINPDLPPIAPRVGIVANMQANVVLEILLGGAE